MTDGHFHPPRGTQGGGDGASSEPYKLLADGSEVPLRPISQEDIQPGELLGHRLSGGGGYGDPYARETEMVRADVLSGFVSLARAGEIYGVAFSEGPVDDSLDIDEAATARLRGGAR